MIDNLLPRVGHILRLAEIIREVDGSHSLGASALAEAILSHPRFSQCHEPTPPPAEGEVAELRKAVINAIADAIGSSAYDCSRVWSAWNVGTMGQDDFDPIVESEERLHKIADAAIQAIEAWLLPTTTTTETTDD